MKATTESLMPWPINFGGYLVPMAPVVASVIPIIDSVIDTGFLTELLPQVLRKFSTQHPDISIQLHDLSTHEMVEGLNHGELDIALMIRASKPTMKGLEFKSLQKLPVCVAAHPSHPLMSEPHVKLTAVAKEPLITYNRDDYPEYHAWLHTLFSKIECEPNIVEEHDGATSLIAAVESGRGIALVQKGFENLSGSRLSILPIVPAPPAFTLGIAHRNGLISDVAKSFLSATLETG